MSVFIRRSCGAALAYAVATQGAYADLTANDVWNDWQEYFRSLGYTVEGEPSSAGDVMTINDMTLSMDFPEEDGQFQMTMPEVTLTENGDGTVNVGFPGSFPMVISGGVEDEQFTANLTYSQTDLEMVVSGDPSDMTYDYSAAALGIVLDSIEGGDEPIPEDALEGGIEFKDMAGTSRMLIGDNREITQTLDADQMAYKFSFKDPETGESGLIDGVLNGLTSSGDSVLPSGFDLADPQALYDAGFAFSGMVAYGSGKTDISGVSEGEQFTMASSSQGGRLEASIDGERVAYDLEQNDAKLAVTTGDLPFPIEIAMAKAGLNLDIPVQESEEAAPFAFGLNLTDFTMSDVLWSIFDPAGNLPRDPATIALDTTGTAKVLLNIFDPEQAAALEEEAEVPAELHSLKINELLVSMVGARLTGDGDFTLDNENLDEFGMPIPTGVANLQLVGANALIDKLIGMGLMSDNDALGARMMMGMMAVPGDEPDTLNSTIEFTEDGQIKANGQRIK
jgi:hypothetical protein